MSEIPSDNDLHDYKCPITQEIFFDPVRMSDNYVYERSAIIQARQTNGNISPMTRQPFKGRIVQDKQKLIQIKNLVKQYPELRKQQFIPTHTGYQNVLDKAFETRNWKKIKLYTEFYFIPSMRCILHTSCNDDTIQYILRNFKNDSEFRILCCDLYKFLKCSIVEIDIERYYHVAELLIVHSNEYNMSLWNHKMYPDIISWMDLSLEENDTRLITLFKKHNIPFYLTGHSDFHVSLSLFRIFYSCRKHLELIEEFVIELKEYINRTHPNHGCLLHFMKNVFKDITYEHTLQIIAILIKHGLNAFKHMDMNYYKAYFLKLPFNIFKQAFDIYLDNLNPSVFTDDPLIYTAITDMIKTYNDVFSNIFIDMLLSKKLSNVKCNIEIVTALIRRGIDLSLIDKYVKKKFKRKYNVLRYVLTYSSSIKDHTLLLDHYKNENLLKNNDFMYLMKNKKIKSYKAFQLAEKYFNITANVHS